MRSPGLWADRRTELDEKVFLIGLFVIVAMAGLTTLGSELANLWTNVATNF